tara:strand:+ start:99647 stop:100018 length:372 start_codon:yes stop_codon:yes gene_type:complete
MNIQQDANTAEYNISRYQPGKIWVNQLCYRNSILISPTSFQADWVPQTFSELQPKHLHNLFDTPPEIFILGTGEHLHFPASEWLLPFYEKGIGVEIMDSLRAVYTYTILCSEERQVAAGILIE